MGSASLRSAALTRSKGGKKKLELPLMSSSINFLSHSSEFGSSPDAPALLQQCPNAVGASVVRDRSCLSPGEKTRPDGGGLSQLLYINTTNLGPPRTTADTSIHGCFFVHSKFSSVVVPEHRETSSYVFSLSSTFQLSFSPLVLVFSNFTIMESLQNSFSLLVLPISLHRTSFLSLFLYFP